MKARVIYLPNCYRAGILDILCTAKQRQEVALCGGCVAVGCGQERVIEVGSGAALIEEVEALLEISIPTDKGDGNKAL